MSPKRLMYMATVGSAGLLVGVALGLPGAGADTTTGPKFKASPRDVIFPDTKVGHASGEQFVTVSNAGGGTLHFDQVKLGRPNPDDFNISTDTCTGANLGTNGACTVGLHFVPKTTGTRVAHLRFDQPGCSDYITVAGNGQPAAVSRLASCNPSGTTTVTVPGGTTTVVQTQTVTVPANPNGGGVAGVVVNGGRCQSHRVVRIHFRPRHGRKFRSGSVHVHIKHTNRNPKVHYSRRTHRYYADLRFFGLKVGRYKILIRGIERKGGRHYRSHRWFVTCISGQTPPPGGSGIGQPNGTTTTSSTTTTSG